MATAPSASISGDEIDCTATERRFARNSRRAAPRNRFISQSSMPNALTIPLPVIVSCTRFWISASLSCPCRVVLRTLLPMRLAELTITGTNSRSTHASLPPTSTTAPIMNTSVNSCCRESLSTVDIAVCTMMSNTGDPVERNANGGVESVTPSAYPACCGTRWRVPACTGTTS